jgi:hypothetical protein
MRGGIHRCWRPCFHLADGSFHQTGCRFLTVLDVISKALTGNPGSHPLSGLSSLPPKTRSGRHSLWSGHRTSLLLF